MAGAIFRTHPELRGKTVEQMLEWQKKHWPGNTGVQKVEGKTQ